MRRMVLIGVVIVGCVAALLGFLATARPPFLTSPASPRMEYWNGLFMQIFWIAMVVGLLVWGLLIYAIIRFRARKDGPKEGPHIHGNTKMEIAWTIAPALVMGWLLVVSFNGLFAIDNGPPQTDTTIQITASQFVFGFEYEDGSKGISPPDALYIEQNKFIKFNITATDVIHAFSVPELGLMKDAIPGRINHDWVRATKVGNYSIKCRELCGPGHSGMVGTIVVFPEGANGGQAFGKPGAAPPSSNATTSPTASVPPTNTTGTGAPTNGTKVPVTLAPGGNFVIDPATIKVDKGTVTFEVMTEGGTTPHNLYIGNHNPSKPDDGALWKSETITGSQSATVTAEFNEDTSFEFWCDVPGHFDLGMKGRLDVGAGGTLNTGPKPLLPGFEALGLLFAVGALVVAWRRRL